MNKQTETFIKNLLITAGIFMVLPAFVGDYNMTILTMFFIWAIVALAWNLLLGFSNIWAFGNLVFFAVGGYTAAYLSLKMGIPPVLGLIAGGCAGAIAGIIIGVPTLRLKMIYLALFTFSAEEFLRNLVVLPEFSPYTGGPIGLQFIPQFKLFNISFLILHYYLGLFLFLLSVSFTWWVENSKIGLALRAIAGSEEAAEAIGVNTYKYKTLAFLVSAFITGIAGAFYSYYFGSITSGALSFELLVSIIFMIVVGGEYSFSGPIIGALVLTFLDEYMRSHIGGLMSNVRLIVMGAIIIGTLLKYPAGLIGFVKQTWSKIKINILSENSTEK